jgi:tetratricopeptide (TPR) repeat protein/outer membrane protein assembly factor BamD (BamD/ComL family)
LISGRSSYRILSVAILLVIAFSCSVEKNTRTTRFYQGLTSRFNIYFNGNESFKAGVAKINAGYRDDFSELLAIFEYSDPSTVQMCASDMERAVQKASKVISLKSITARPESKDNSMPSEKEEEFMNRKEYNEWVDDSYLLLGKARLYKRDYNLAKSTLSFNISSSYDPEKRAESTIWLARVYNETGNYNESYRILNELDIASGFTESLRALYYTTLADLYLKQKRYSDAIDPLGRAIENTAGKRTRYRLTYLLAQLCEKTGDESRATSLYREVVKMNPPYEVEFNARINLAGVFDPNTGNPVSVKKELERMLRDSKNREFRDQIYFALGNLFNKEGNAAEAVERYKKSAAVSTNNTKQKAKSYLALAEYYFSRPDYVNSGLYYDSAVMFLDEKYPDYKLLRAKSQNLNALLEQINIIQREDSLQKVAAMSASDRNTLIAGIIEKVKADESRGASASDANADRYNLGQYYENERRFQGNIEQEGKWYFYNQAALTFGRTEFRRRWGDRKLEDNWRRLNKSRQSSAQSASGPEEKTQAGSDSVSSKINNKNPEFYMANLPINDSLKSISNRKIAGAYLEAGKIYNERFRDNSRAIESFEALLNRFPGDLLEPETLFSIFRVYREDSNQRAELYRERLIEKYPGNEFTKSITDPDYYTKKSEAAREAERLYSEAYGKYISEDFTGAVDLCNNALETFARHELAPKFMLLKAYCTARIADERTFKEELSKLVKQWPDTPESARAADLIAFLNKEIPELQVEEDKQVAAEIYTDDLNSTQSFVLIIKNGAFNINQASFDVISYNIDNYTNSNYRTQGSLVDDKFIMLTVSGFKTLQEAIDYYNNFRIEQVVRNPSKVQIYSFLIGKSNLETLLKDKNPDRYLLFFGEKYPKENERK